VGGGLRGIDVLVEQLSREMGVLVEQLFSCFTFVIDVSIALVAK